MVLYAARWLCQDRHQQRHATGPAWLPHYRKLAPGPWLHSVSEAEYCRLYKEILGALKPHVVLAEIQALAGPAVPALLCFEYHPPIPSGVTAGSCLRGLSVPWVCTFPSSGTNSWGLAARTLRARRLLH